MHVAGVVPVGSRGLGTLQTVVTDPKPAAGYTPSSSAGPRAAAAVPHTVTAEPVVFPRDGLPTDQRPVQLRQLKAAARYKEAKDLARRPKQ